MGTLYKKVDKDFDYEDKQYWYVAEVTVTYTYVAETYDSPMESDSDYEVSVIEITEYIGNGKEKILAWEDLPEALREAVEQDALSHVQEGGE